MDDDALPHFAALHGVGRTKGQDAVGRGELRAGKAWAIGTSWEKSRECMGSLGNYGHPLRYWQVLRDSRAWDLACILRVRLAFCGTGNEHALWITMCANFSGKLWDIVQPAIH